MADELISREVLFKQETFLRDEDGFEHSCVLSSDIRRTPSVNAVVLPCKVGDTLWLTYDDGTDEGVCKVRVQGISVSVTGDDVVLHFGGYPAINAWGSEIGKTVFLTREEAEKALEGREDNAN